MENVTMMRITVLLLVTLLGVCRGTELDLTVDVPPGKQECFWEEIPASIAVELDYQVIDGGDLDIDLLIAGPDNRVYHMDQRKTENLVKFRSQNAGHYRFCFDNTFSRISNKAVYFELFLEDGKDDEAEDDAKFSFEGEGIDSAQLNLTIKQFLGILDRVQNNLESSVQVQTLIRIHEAKDRNTQEANFFRVNFLSCVQLALMISVGLVQVIMIRSLFSDRKPVSGTSLKTRT